MILRILIFQLLFEFFFFFYLEIFSFYELLTLFINVQINVSIIQKCVSIAYDIGFFSELAYVIGDFFIEEAYGIGFFRGFFRGFFSELAYVIGDFFIEEAYVIGDFFI